MADKKFDKINSVEALEAKLVEIRAAEEVWATFPQEKVDAICEAAAMAADKMRIPLAKMAHEETKAGIVVDKITKNIEVVVTVSANADELSEDLKKYVI